MFRTTAVLVFGWSAFAAIAISITGVDALRRSNPDLFAVARAEGRAAAPGGRALRRRDPGRGALRVAFPERTAEDEPFVSWGSVEAFDVLRVRTVSPGVFVFSLDTDAGRLPDREPRPPHVRRRASRPVASTISSSTSTG